MTKDVRLDALEDLFERLARDRQPVVLEADDRVGRIWLDADEVGDGVGELGRATRIVDLGGVDALNPGVYVHDRAHARVLHVDLPMLDRVDGYAARLDAGRYRHHHRLCGLVVVGHEQHVAPNNLFECRSGT